MCISLVWSAHLEVNNSPVLSEEACWGEGNFYFNPTPPPQAADKVRLRKFSYHLLLLYCMHPRSGILGCKVVPSQAFAIMTGIACLGGVRSGVHYLFILHFEVQFNVFVNEISFSLSFCFFVFIYSFNLCV